MSPQQIDEALIRYAAKESAASIARAFGVCYGTIYHHARHRGLTPAPNPILPRGCAQCGTPFTPASYREQKFCSRTCRLVGHGARITEAKLQRDVVLVSNGYRHVVAPVGHISRSRRSHRLPEHVLIAEVALGRPLGRSEVVHHINGDKADNRRCNLLICTRSYHNALHSRMADMYQREKFGRVA